MYRGSIQVTYELLEELLKLKDQNIQIVGVYQNESNAMRGITTLLVESEDKTEYTYKKIEGGRVYNTFMNTESNIHY